MLKTCDECEGYGEDRFDWTKCSKCDGTGKVKVEAMDDKQDALDELTDEIRHKKSLPKTCTKCGGSTVVNNGYEPARATCLLCGHTTGGDDGR